MQICMVLNPYWWWMDINTSKSRKLNWHCFAEGFGICKYQGTYLSNFCHFVAHVWLPAVVVNQSPASHMLETPWLKMSSSTEDVYLIIGSSPPGEVRTGKSTNASCLSSWGELMVPSAMEVKFSWSCSMMARRSWGFCFFR